MMFDLSIWLQREALPLWSAAGFDAELGVFVERLDTLGNPLLDTPRRVMVQARQIFVYAASHARGWCDGAAIAEQAGETLVRLYRADGLPGWAFSIARDGSIIDGKRDFYAQAFVLFALAHLARLTGAKRWLDLADQTLAFMDDAMAIPASGGYSESWPLDSAVRRQNPHMHLLGALLALQEADADRGYLKRAGDIVDLMRRRFIHGPGGVLVETYDQDFEPLLVSPFAFEPGHHCEWAWLLARYSTLVGQPVPPLATHLWRSAAESFTADGTIFDEISGAGAVLKRSTRLWPYAEAARAATLGLDRDDVGSKRPDALRITTEMHKRFLAPATPGCWVDRLSETGAPLSIFVPASSLYHITGAAFALSAGRP